MNKSKNKQIASILKCLAETYKDMAFNMELLQKILLEPEKVQASTSNKNAGCQYCGLYDSLPNSNYCSECEKDARMDAVINENYNRSLDKESTRVTTSPDFFEEPKTEVDILDALKYDYIKEIDRNSAFVYFKRTTGTHCGSVITQNISTGEIVDHKYTANNPLHKQLCIVSNDHDGLNYLSAQVRPSVRARVYIMNMKRFSDIHYSKVSHVIAYYYRPWKSGNHKNTHLAVYMRQRRKIEGNHA